MEIIERYSKYKGAQKIDIPSCVLENALIVS